MMLAVIFMPMTLVLFLFEKSISNFFISYVYESDLEQLLIYDKMVIKPMELKQAKLKDLSKF